MASMNFYSMALVAIVLVSAPLAAVAGYPDILTDFVVPTSLIGIPINITGDYFTYIGFCPVPLSTVTFAVCKASMAEFPALNGQSVSYTKLRFPPGTVNPTHTHPRAAELLLLLEGTLSIGFVDTAGKLYTKDLVPGDMFMFPKGLVHYQSNQGTLPATTLSAFGSCAPGTVSVPITVFDTGVNDVVVAKSFKTDMPTVSKLKAALTLPPKK